MDAALGNTALGSEQEKKDEERVGLIYAWRQNLQVDPSVAGVYIHI